MLEIVDVSTYCNSNRLVSFKANDKAIAPLSPILLLWRLYTLITEFNDEHVH